MDLTELGAGAIFAYVIIKEVLTFLKSPKKQEASGKMAGQLKTIGEGVATLVVQHSTKDSEGRPVWWNKKETNNQLDKVSESLSKCIELVRETHHQTQKQIQETHGLLREMLIRMEKP